MNKQKSEWITFCLTVHFCDKQKPLSKSHFPEQPNVKIENNGCTLIIHVQMQHPQEYYTIDDVKYNMNRCHNIDRNIPTNRRV